MHQIYIVDDNTEFAEYLAVVARREGWTTDICTNGLELLDSLKKGSGPALLLVDINMPVLDGIEVIDGIADQDRPLRICFMTGGADPAMIAAKMIAKARDLQVGKNIYKPLSKSTFTSILQVESNALDSL